MLDNCAVWFFIQCFDDINDISVEVEELRDLSQALVPYTIECFLDVDEVMLEDTLVLQMFLYQQSNVEDVFFCTTFRWKSCIFFC